MSSFSESSLIRHNSSVPVYKYTTFERAKEIILNNEIYFSTAGELNDPLELHPALLDYRFDKDEKEKHIELLLQKLNLNQYTGLRDSLLCVPDEVFMYFLKENFKAERDTIGIFSTSQKYNNDVMWGNYANNNNGVCLGFKNLDNYDTNLVSCCVNYVDTNIPYRILSDTNILYYNSILYWVFTKNVKWKYEDEVRILNTNFQGLTKFNRSSLCEIYYGYKLRSSSIIEMENLLKDGGYSLDMHAKVEIDDKDYQFKFNRL